ncbi:MAG: acetoacetate--CoA ligase [Nitrososphaerota archaeon]|jgi:acetoacetyl-CoA synthetase|nr:acetoacetate--CoA ligase [Nitrososphaerota archaeon]MDG6942049.1 acetoacetate--CoA ligase [Nitrososphaerota archaeon]MDG6942514.1 acetoacetate--CoA ligase [Nitrososphaerota archaeon]MDG6948301.1 acetoacetate--CoA ligase [Nitrososphaerota archaeon]MDG6950227.1 acetoacetate--CoA ligase [Nitrososphaerota archaeon]
MREGRLLWEPDPGLVRRTAMSAYMKWLEKRGSSFEGYDELWRWSVDDLEGFWGSIWKYFDVAGADYPVLAERKMPGAKWFDGAELNFAERVFAKGRDGPALICRGERAQGKVVAWQELERKTAALARTLRDSGVGRGDRVAGYLPNGPEAIVGVLAAASVGAIWSGSPPEFGTQSVVDRFGQIGPKVLIATDGYSYGGKWTDRADDVSSIVKSIPSIKKVISVSGGSKGRGLAGSDAWEEATGGKEKLDHEFVPFEHPLWILYSSGTTGLPKPIVHSHGGILVELLKSLALHNDIREGDRFFWYTTTGWMMWNYLLGGLLHGATLVLYNGHPAWPRPDSLWSLMEETETTYMGTSAAYISACMKARVEPRGSFSLSTLRGIGSTGSPLSTDGFEWVYAKVKDGVWLESLSGGTDVCTAFVTGSPTLPVYSGELQCRALGASVQAFDENGSAVVGKVGELVITEPMPSMPVFFWGDEDGSRYRESYFDMFPGVWRHGDWIKVTSRGTCVIYGRSDATIKRQGVRIGTSEIYRAVEKVPEVSDSMAVDVVSKEGGEEMVLFVSLNEGASLDEELAAKIKAQIRADLSSRYLPDRLVAVPAIPRTLNGKKLEVPVKRILAGADPEKVLNKGSLADPASVEHFVKIAKGLIAGGRGDLEAN